MTTNPPRTSRPRTSRNTNSRAEPSRGGVGGVMAAMVAMAIVAGCTGGSDAAPTTTATTLPATTLPAATTTTAAPSTTTTVAENLYRATITRTEYGIPHIVADDWGSLGFGQGYAFAEDRACTLIDQVIKVRGERARWFGPGNDDANLTSDYAYRHLGLHEDADERFAGVSTRVVEIIAGYVAGFNAQVIEQAPSGWCAGEPWVQPITATDLFAYLNDVALFASSGVLLQPIANATPPDGSPPAIDISATTIVAPDTTTVSPATVLPATVLPATVLPTTTSLGSNGWAIGSDLSAGGGGLLLANPHFPWEGEKRLWESQLTLTTGELDVYGATLSGVPGVLIGFNNAVAWTHTVSAGNRMTLYELDLDPASPTTYRYGDEMRPMTPTEITIDVLQTNGTTSKEARTMWASHYGPMLELPFGWTATTAYTMRDANIGNADIVEQFLGMATSTNLDEFIDVHRTVNAIPWVNTVAVSADGRAWYADTAATPNLSEDTIDQWQSEVDTEGSIASLVRNNGAVLLDGSNPANEWLDDPAAARPGILPYDQQPTLERDDFVFNANDSHWLANPDEVLTGFSPLTGPEEVPQSARTRMNAVLLTDPAQRGDDDRFDLAEVEAAIMSSRSLHAELLLPAVIETCERTTLVLVDGVPYSLTPACDVLKQWNGRYTTDARGAALWREYMALFTTTARNDAGPLYKEGFDADDPVGTPNTYNDDVDIDVLANLGAAAKAMTAAGFALDAPLGDMQFDGRLLGPDAPSERIPLPGGTSVDGTATIVGCCSRPSTLGPKGDAGSTVSPQSFRPLGYPITTGNSFMMAVEFTDAGPTARAVLTYGQPDDRESPDFTSQTKVYSSGAFRPVRFTPADIAADPTATVTEVSAAK